MASPHLSVQRARTASSTEPALTARAPRRVGRFRAAVLLTAAASLGLTLLPGTADATPGNAVTQARTAAEATQLVADAQHHLEAVSEQVNDAQVTLEQQQGAADAAGAALAAAQEQLAVLDGQMRQVARSAFTGQNLSRFNALMTSGSAEEFLAQVNTLDVIAGHTSDVLAQVGAAAAAATEAETAADGAAAAAKQSLDDVSAQQADLQAGIADYTAQYDELSAAQQAQVAQAHAGPALEAPDTVSVSTVSSPSAASAATDATAGALAPSEAAQTAVETALAQVGDAYVWGAGGPSAFDCSGLMQYAYAAAGITLPHSSRAQSAMGAAVSRSELQPGDMVFFYSPVSHVGMYVGNGKMVHAATFGVPVQVTSVDMKGYVGARRMAG
ncbi:C40 family peptidase [Modestobacter sp. DSM 44400]|uniref:C40 family peptidase n=1 Tax=Modestobacter sp. DSM 44400 TaxID=1550230 RepID=UPI000B87BB51|nr:C40 family peptidase [Modestobacter sp. DSM 44400]